MVTAERSMFQLTAADLMTPASVVLRQQMPLHDAASELLKAGVHGAPVIDGLGECVGVLSLTDLARWAVNQDHPPAPRPRACTFQEDVRSVRGRRTTLCTLTPGGCAFQNPVELPGSVAGISCREPGCVGVEWQMVPFEQLPADDVGHYMTTGAITADLGMPITELARVMLDSCVQRVIIVDATRHPVGVVSVTDLVTAIAAADDGSRG